MRTMLVIGAFLVVGPLWAETPKTPTARDAFKPLALLVGSWKGSGTPEEGTKEERQKGFWLETVTWGWQFKGDDAWLTVTFDKGKFFTKGELRRGDKEQFTFSVENPAKEKLTYSGTLKDKQLVLERTTDAKLVERLTINLLHDNRILYRVDTKPATGTLWTKKYQVGLTKEGIAFAITGPSERDCIVTGGLGTMTVTYEGKTYYVCCSGCRDEFKASPKKYVEEWEAKLKKK